MDGNRQHFSEPHAQVLPHYLLDFRLSRLQADVLHQSRLHALRRVHEEVVLVQVLDLLNDHLPALLNLISATDELVDELSVLHGLPRECTDLGNGDLIVRCNLTLQSVLNKNLVDYLDLLTNR